MSDFHPPVTNAIPMPAPIAPIVDELPMPEVPMPAMPQLSPPSAEATVNAHLGIVEDLSLDANLRAKLGTGGTGASAGTELQYGTDANGASIYATADSQNGVDMGGRLALTDEQLRMKLEANPDGVRAAVSGGDEDSGAEIEGGVTEQEGVTIAGKVRTGPVVVSGEGRQLATAPEGHIATDVETEIGDHVKARGGGVMESGPNGTKGGGRGEVDIETPAGTIQFHGHGETDGKNGSGGGGVIFQGQF
jgi:hypothetical protein